MIPIQQNRIRSIDLVKGIAILMVIIVHFNQTWGTHAYKLFEFGQMGCQIFFVTSGFGVALSIKKRGWGDTLSFSAIKAFYQSRMKAIAPAYYITFIIVFIFNSVCLLIYGTTLTFGKNRSIVSIICNLLFLNGLLPFCNNNVMPGGWYIGTTVLLYLITPLLIRLLQKAGKYKELFCIVTSTVSLGVLIVFSISTNNLDFVANNSFGYYSILTQYPCYCMGILLFFNIQGYNQTDTNKAIVLHGVLSVIFTLLAGIVFFYPFSYSFIIDANLIGGAVYNVLFCMIVMERSSRNFVKGYIFEALGRRSYYIYLLHAFFAHSLMYSIIDNFFVFESKFLWAMLYFLLLMVVIGLSWWSGIVLELITGFVTKSFFKANVTRKQRGC